MLDDLIPAFRRIVRSEVKELQSRGVLPRRDPFGTVTGISPTTIRLDGEQIDVQYDLVDAGLTLAIGDRVLLHRAGSRLFVAHRLAP